MGIKDLSGNPTGYKIFAFAAVPLLIFVAGSSVFRSSGSQASGYSEPVEVGRIQAEDIRESSGLSASECQDVLWTHNDAGNEPVIFAMATNGGHLGAWKVQNSINVDWESIATHRGPDGKCYLLIGDFGDNDENRRELSIYRIPEPVVSKETASATARKPLETPPAEQLRFTYPDGPRNAETILVHPKNGDIYVLTKNKRGPSEVHKLKQDFSEKLPAITQKVAEISVPSRPEGLLTGGSISPDGTRVMLCDVKNGYELVLPDTTADFDTIWKQKPAVVDLGSRKQGEGVSYGRDGLTLYASSEKKSTPILLIRRK